MPTPEEWKRLELDAASAVARPPSNLGTALKFAIPLGAMLFAGFIIYAGMRTQKPSFTRPDNEEFRTTQFPAPALGEPPPQRDQGVITVPPPPPEPPPAPVAPPAVLAAPPPAPEPPLREAAAPPREDDGEARRRQEEERRRWERLRAGSIVVDQGGEVVLAQGAPGQGGASTLSCPRAR
jgi:type IV secretion system protein VirB10